jgi:hypothetical protein
MSRPSLRITRHGDQDPPEQIVFEVWNPLAGVYELMYTPTGCGFLLPLEFGRGSLKWPTFSVIA